MRNFGVQISTISKSSLVGGRFAAGLAVALVLLALSMLVPFDQTAQADEHNPVITTNLKRTIVFENDQFFVDVVLYSPVTDLYAVQFEMTFDPSVVTVVDADDFTDGVQIEVGSLMAVDLVETPGPDFITVRNEVEVNVDNTQGRISLAVALLNPAPPAEVISDDVTSKTAGALARITFKATALDPVTKNPQQTNLTFSNAVLSDVDGREITSTLQSGRIDVIEKGVCGDQNDDGKVTVADVIIDLQISAELIIPTASQLKLSDLDNNGEIDPSDAILGLQRVVGIPIIIAGCGEVSP